MNVQSPGPPWMPTLYWCKREVVARYFKWSSRYPGSVVMSWRFNSGIIFHALPIDWSFECFKYPLSTTPALKTSIRWLWSKPLQICSTLEPCSWYFLARSACWVLVSWAWSASVSMVRDVMELDSRWLMVEVEVKKQKQVASLYYVYCGASLVKLCIRKHPKRGGT